MNPRHLLETYFRNPDERAFAPLYERTRERVWTLCLRILRNPDDAQDAFQLTYTRLHALALSPAADRTAALRDHDALSLTARLAILESRALSARRQRRQRREAAVPTLPDAPHTGPTADHVARQKQTRAVLEAAVAQLPEAHALVLQLHYFNDLSRAEIAAALGLSTKALDKRIQRATAQLEPILRRAGLRDSTALLAAVAGAGVGAGLAQPPAAAAFSAASIHAGAAAAAPALVGSAASASSLFAGVAPAATSGGLASTKTFILAVIAIALLTGTVLYHRNWHHRAGFGTLAVNVTPALPITAGSAQTSGRPTPPAPSALDLPGESAATADTATTGNLTVRIVRTDTRAPLADVEVNLLRQLDAPPRPGAGSKLLTAKTSLDGSAHFENLAARGRFLLMLDCPGFVREARELTYSPAHPDLTVSLSPAHFLAGTVVDSSGAPLSPVQLTVEDPQPHEFSRITATTNPAGEFRLERLPAAPLRILVTILREATYRYTYEEHRLNRTDARIVVGLPPFKSYTLEGEVVEAQLNNPILNPKLTLRAPVPGAAVAVKGNRFRIEKLPWEFGNFLEIEAAGFPRTVRQLPTPHHTDDGDEPVKMTIELWRSISVAGRVLDASGQPLPDFWVRRESRESPIPPLEVHTTEGWAQTDAQGFFQIEAVESGPGWFWVKGAGADLRKKFFDMEIPQQSQLFDAGDLTMPKGGSISISVRDAAGKPLPNEEFAVDCAHDLGNGQALFSLTADANGIATSPQLSPGWATVKHTRSGAMQMKKLTAGATIQFPFQIGGRTATIRVVGAHPADGRHPVVELSRGSLKIKDPERISSDVYRIRDLAPGLYEVTVYPGGWLGGLRVIEPLSVPSGADTTPIELTIVIPSGGITGTVRDQNGNPVDFAVVSLLGPANQGADHDDFRTNQTGIFTFGLLPPGTYGLLAHKPGVGIARVENIEVLDRPAPAVNVVLAPSPVGSLESLAVAGDSQQPLAKAWSTLRLRTAPADPDADLITNPPTGPAIPALVMPPRGADGVQRIRDVPVGTYDLEVTAWGYSISRRTITIVAGETTKTEDVLFPAGSVRATVLDPAGRPATGARCECEPADPASLEPPRRGIIDTYGRWSDRGLAPGTYRLTIYSQATGAELLRTTFDIKPNADTPLALTLPAAPAK